MTNRRDPDEPAHQAVLAVVTQFIRTNEDAIREIIGMPPRFPNTFWGKTQKLIAFLKAKANNFFSSTYFKPCLGCLFFLVGIFAFRRNWLSGVTNITLGIFYLVIWRWECRIIRLRESYLTSYVNRIQDRRRHEMRSSPDSDPSIYRHGL